MSDNGQHDSSYTMTCQGTEVPFIRITSDNVFEFVATNQQVWQHSQSIVTSIHNGYHSKYGDTERFVSLQVIRILKHSVNHTS